MKEPFCEKASPKRLKERLIERIAPFYSSDVIRPIIDEEFEGLVAHIQNRLKQIDERYVNKRSRDMAKLDLLDEVLESLGD